MMYCQNYIGTANSLKLKPSLLLVFVSWDGFRWYMVGIPGILFFLLVAPFVFQSQKVDMKHITYSATKYRRGGGKGESERGQACLKFRAVVTFELKTSTDLSMAQFATMH